MEHNKRIASLLQINPSQVDSAVKLLDDGNTIPFIARYRKDMTLNLDEFQLRKIEEKIKYFRQVDDRREQIIRSIQNQDRMDESLRNKLLQADGLSELEEIYRPYKSKRVTRAMKAINSGLMPLAQRILEQKIERISEDTLYQYRSDDYDSSNAILQGARDIIAQIIADDVYVRKAIVSQVLEWGRLYSTKIKSAIDEQNVFKLYYDFSNRIKWLKPYQILALNRGESEKILRIKVDIDERDWNSIICRKYKLDLRSPWKEHLELAISESAQRLLLPSVIREIRSQLTENAEEHAIDVFANNLEALLMQPPLRGYVVMGIDPGFRSGCKVAVVDEIGVVLDTVTIYPNPPQSLYHESLNMLSRLIQMHHITLISIGNGTASRETEQLVAEVIKNFKDISYLLVNEAGASVYSASEIAREELGYLDVSMRGAVSIARRIQDPLAELVKIDPRSIGVGLYQHDLNQTKLSRALEIVIEIVVSKIGVDLNTSSAILLKYVSGISDSVASNIIEYRETKGAFVDLLQLFEIKGLGAKSFEQSAGFLRIYDGANWLDTTAIHPENYEIASRLIELVDINVGLSNDEKKECVNKYLKSNTLRELNDIFDCGEITLIDIFDQLCQPSRDPRDEIASPILRREIMSIDDLYEGLILQGIVRNVVDFGAFVDIGVKQDGLLHISKIPQDINLVIGDIITIKIVSVEVERGRIGLTLNG